MKKTSNAKGTLEALLIIGLILIIPLFFVMRSAATAVLSSIDLLKL